MHLLFFFLRLQKKLHIWQSISNGRQGSVLLVCFWISVNKKIIERYIEIIQFITQVKEPMYREPWPTTQGLGFSALFWKDVPPDVLYLFCAFDVLWCICVYIKLQHCHRLQYFTTFCFLSFSVCVTVTQAFISNTRWGGQKQKYCRRAIFQLGGMCRISYLQAVPAMLSSMYSISASSISQNVQHEPLPRRSQSPEL